MFYYKIYRPSESKVVDRFHNNIPINFLKIYSAEKEGLIFLVCRALAYIILALYAYSALVLVNLVLIALALDICSTEYISTLLLPIFNAEHIPGFLKLFNIDSLIVITGLTTLILILLKHRPLFRIHFFTLDPSVGLPNINRNNLNSCDYVFAIYNVHPIIKDIISYNHTDCDLIMPVSASKKSAESNLRDIAMAILIRTSTLAYLEEKDHLPRRMRFLSVLFRPLLNGYLLILYLYLLFIFIAVTFDMSFFLNSEILATIVAIIALFFWLALSIKKYRSTMISISEVMSVSPRPWSRAPFYTYSHDSSEWQEFDLDFTYDLFKHKFRIEHQTILNLILTGFIATYLAIVSIMSGLF